MQSAGLFDWVLKVDLTSLSPWLLLFSGASVLLMTASLWDRLGEWLRGSDSSRDLESARAKERITELEEKVQRLRSVFRDSALLNSTLNYERVLELIIDLAASAVAKGSAEDSRLVSVIFLFEDDRLRVASARGLSQPDMRIVLYARDGIVERALSTGRMQITDLPAADPELRNLLILQRCLVAVCIPLVVGLEAYGLLLFAHPSGEYFGEEDIELLETLSRQAMVALQNARLYRDLEMEKERIAEIQEETRNKLARDLHDGPTQSVGAIAMRVNFARRLVERDTKKASDELFKIEELARRTTKEIRQMLFTLRPLILESAGLIPALEQLAAKMKDTHEQDVFIEAEPAAVADMEVGKQGVVFFIVEEAANNARKHARARNIWVRLRRKNDMAILEIEDDGIGFEIKEVESNYDQRGSMGLVNLHERAELVNGSLRIDSEVGRGTCVIVSIPLTVEAAERLHRPGYPV